MQYLVIKVQDNGFMIQVSMDTSYRFVRQVCTTYSETKFLKIQENDLHVPKAVKYATLYCESFIISLLSVETVQYHSPVR